MWIKKSMHNPCVDFLIHSQKIILNLKSLESCPTRTLGMIDCKSFSRLSISLSRIYFFAKWQNNVKMTARHFLLVISWAFNPHLATMCLNNTAYYGQAQTRTTAFKFGFSWRMQIYRARLIKFIENQILITRIKIVWHFVIKIILIKFLKTGQG